jgi:mannose/fructose/N-acetylgalactosamine-specific phosphotransferase system component IIC
MKQHPVENAWTALTAGLISLTFVDMTLIGLAVVSFIISTVVNYNAYKKDRAERKLAEEKLKQLQDEEGDR